MDQLRRRNGKGHALGIAGRRPVGEAATHGDDHVGGGGNLVAAQGAGLADAAGEQRVIFRETALAVPGGHHRDFPGFGEGKYFRAGLTGNDPAADDQHRAFGGFQFFHRPRRGGRVREAFADRGAFFQGMQGHFSRFGLYIHRDFQVHRTRPPGDHRTPGAVHHERQLFDAGGDPMALGDGFGDFREIVVGVAFQLLQQTVAAHVGGWPAGDQHQAGGVGEGGGHADHGIGRAGTDGGDGRHRLAAYPVVAIGEVHRALLVEDLDELEFRVLLEEGVGERPDAMARDTGDVLDAIVFQGLRHDLAAGQFSHDRTPWLDEAGVVASVCSVLAARPRVAQFRPCLVRRRIFGSARLLVSCPME